MHIARLSLAVVVPIICSCANGERIREVVYLEPAEDNRVADPTEWERFEKICETHAISAGAQHKADMDSYPRPGCRSWWITRRDATISFDVEVCPVVTREASLGAPNAIVGTWPRLLNPFSKAEAAANRAGIYDALRHEFGDRVKVVRL